MVQIEDKKGKIIALECGNIILKYHSFFRHPERQCGDPGSQRLTLVYYELYSAAWVQFVVKNKKNRHRNCKVNLIEEVNSSFKDLLMIFLKVHLSSILEAKPE